MDLAFRKTLFPVPFFLLLGMQLVWLVMRQSPRARQRNDEVHGDYKVPPHLLYTPEVVRSLAAMVDEDLWPSEQARADAESWHDSLQPFHRHAYALALLQAGPPVTVFDELSPSDLIVHDYWKVFFF